MDTVLARSLPKSKGKFQLRIMSQIPGPLLLAAQTQCTRLPVWRMITTIVHPCCGSPERRAAQVPRAHTCISSTISGSSCVAQRSGPMAAASGVNTVRQTAARISCDRSWHSRRTAPTIRASACASVAGAANNRLGQVCLQFTWRLRNRPISGGQGAAHLVILP